VYYKSDVLINFWVHCSCSLLHFVVYQEYFLLEVPVVVLLNVHILILFVVNCWPSENGQGGCDVNIEYELEHEKMELNDVCITIPLP
jgi:hypothetical protein